MLVDNILRSFKRSFILLAIALSLFSSCEYKKTDSIPPFKLECKVSPDFDIDGGKKHLHKIYRDVSLVTYQGGIKSKKEFHSAPQSALLKGDYKYCFGTTIKHLQPDQFYQVSAWRKDPFKKSCLVVAGGFPTIFSRSSTRVVETAENGWEKILLEFEIPPNMDSITIFAFLSISDSSYFDDLVIELIAEKEYLKHNTPEVISLYFTEEQMQRFQDERLESFRTGLHFSRDSWEKGSFSSRENILPIKTRLKGDLLDHIQGAKWSFRVKIRKGKTFKRMKAFSLQTPESRYYLHEYVSHQLFLQEGLLTTRYDFAPVYINSKSRGNYAIEEHFAKQLIEFNLRREGPILKFDEDTKWRNTVFGLNPKAKERYRSLMPEYQSSRIIPFSASDVVKNPKLKSQFEIAHSLIFQYKNRLTPAEEIFDIEKTAKFLALTDLLNGKHGTTWHNQRFYYNPINCKIELINYDNFTSSIDKEKSAHAHIFSFDQNFTDVSENLIYPSLFTTDTIVKKYISYLEKYTQESFLLEFYNSQKESIEYYLTLLKKEFPAYHIDSSFQLKNAHSLRNEIPELKKKLASGYFENINLIDQKVEVSNQYRPSIIPLFLNAYYSTNDSNSTLVVENFNPRKLVLLGLKGEKGKILYEFQKEIEIDKFQSGHPSDTLLNIPTIPNVSKLIFKDLDSNTIFETELTLWRKNTEKSPYQRLLVSDKAKPEQLFLKKGDTLLLSLGKYQLTERILIPENRIVVFEAGVELDMINNAAIISHSALQMKGTESGIIKITSSDYSSNGIVVLQANKKSIIKHTIFSKLNTLDYLGWTLSGAVNFYESEVEINHSTFEHNQCEDALNIIRSNFKVNNCKFLNIYADAFDSDFCTGILENSLFDRVGNDAIDFSTSQIKIENCTIKNIQDKGISGGEGSTLWVKNTTMEQCNIGVASKDLSEVSLENCSIANCKYGLVVLKKKAEYGPAKITTNELTLTNCKEDLLIEKKSSIFFNGNLIIGKKEKVAEMFY
ncbi:MAG: CotH kinase family protein [Flavobacteriales bacterium]|nr:CotH kinase family protein [Flavobacteriales bacterium]